MFITSGCKQADEMKNYIFTKCDVEQQKQQFFCARCFCCFFEACWVNTENKSKMFDFPTRKDHRYPAFNEFLTVSKSSRSLLKCSFVHSFIYHLKDFCNSCSAEACKSVRTAMQERLNVPFLQMRGVRPEQSEGWTLKNKKSFSSPAERFFISCMSQVQDHPPFQADHCFYISDLICSFQPRQELNELLEKLLYYNDFTDLMGRYETLI